MTLTERIEAIAPMLQRTRESIKSVQYVEAADAIEEVLDCLDEFQNTLVDLNASLEDLRIEVQNIPAKTDLHP